MVSVPRATPIIIRPRLASEKPVWRDPAIAIDCIQAGRHMKELWSLRWPTLARKGLTIADVPVDPERWSRLNAFIKHPVMLALFRLCAHWRSGRLAHPHSG